MSIRIHNTGCVEQPPTRFRDDGQTEEADKLLAAFKLPRVAWAIAVGRCMALKLTN